MKVLLKDGTIGHIINIEPGAFVIVELYDEKGNRIEKAGNVVEVIDD